MYLPTFSNIIMSTTNIEIENIRIVGYIRINNCAFCFTHLFKKTHFVGAETTRRIHDDVKTWKRFHTTSL